MRGIIQPNDNTLAPFLREPIHTKKLSQASEPSPGLSDNGFKLRPQRRVNLETLVEVPLRFRLASLLQIANAAFSSSPTHVRIAAKTCNSVEFFFGPGCIA
jgi:hypothetical protein